MPISETLYILRYKMLYQLSKALKETTQEKGEDELQVVLNETTVTILIPAHNNLRQQTNFRVGPGTMDYLAKYNFRAPRDSDETDLLLQLSRVQIKIGQVQLSMPGRLNVYTNEAAEPDYIKKLAEKLFEVYQEITLKLRPGISQIPDVLDNSFEN
jgi:hypothetical protein